MNNRIHRKQKQEAGGVSAGVLFGLLCLCVVGVMAYFCVQAEAPRRLWSPVVIEANGNETTLGDSRQLEFWTPSVETKDYLPKDASGEIAPTDKWQVVPSDDTILQFGLVLHTNKSVLGYRRVQAWGQGHTIFKPGWWWTLNVLTNYSAMDLGRTYQDYWKSHQAVFIEVIDNRGRSE